MPLTRHIIPICFDLDHTLLDTLQIRKDIFTLTRPYGAGPGLLKRAYRAAVVERFTPQKFVVHLGLPQEKSRELLGKILILLQATRRYYVYPQVPRLLSRLSKITQLYLVTHGDEEYQRIKLQQSGLAHYFTRVIVTPDIAKEKILRTLYREARGHILMNDDSRRVHASAKRIGFPLIKVRKAYKDKTYIDSLCQKNIKEWERLTVSL